MRSRQIIHSILFSALLAAGSASSAYAQFGVGFGSWGGQFGSWIEFRPRVQCCPSSELTRRPKTIRQDNGFLEGSVTLKSACPDAQAEMACPLPSGKLNEFTIVAQPFGSNQWSSTTANAQGYYRLILPPGGYNVTLKHPAIRESDITSRQIIIQPGQANVQRFNLTIPIK